jgi:hypothetical protein
VVAGEDSTPSWHQKKAQPVRAGLFQVCGGAGGN